MNVHKNFEAKVYILTKKEGGVKIVFWQIIHLNFFLEQQILLYY